MTHPAYAAYMAPPEWRPRQLTHDINPVEVLSSSAGLSRLIEMFTTDPMWKELKPCLPRRVGFDSYDPLQFALLFIVGFWLGYDCLEDLEKMRDDPVIRAMFGDVPCAKSFGNFLRDFDDELLEKLRALLRR
jgi:hypothetical protein